MKVRRTSDKDWTSTLPLGAYCHGLPVRSSTSTLRTGPSRPPRRAGPPTARHAQPAKATIRSGQRGRPAQPGSVRAAFGRRELGHQYRHGPPTHGSHTAPTQTEQPSAGPRLAAGLVHLRAGRPCRTIPSDARLVLICSRDGGFTAASPQRLRARGQPTRRRTSTRGPADRGPVDRLVRTFSTHSRCQDSTDNSELRFDRR